MDKQIMDLSRGSSQSNKDFIDLMKHPKEEDNEPVAEDNEVHSNNGIKKEGIVPSYDFQPIRKLGGDSTHSSHYDSAPNLTTFSSAWDSDSKDISSSSIGRVRFSVLIVVLFELNFEYELKWVC